MKNRQDRDLNRLLRSARLPDCGNDYWATFPQRVLRFIHRPRQQSSPVVASRQSWPVWRIAACAACLVICGMSLEHWIRSEKTDASNLLQNETLIREMVTMFPNRLRAIVQDEHGISLEVSENDDVPVSTPVWLKLCWGSDCYAVVTFSGQEVRFHGQLFEVLLDAKGGVILVGDQFVWHSGDSPVTRAELKVEGKSLAYVF